MKIILNIAHYVTAIIFGIVFALVLHRLVSCKSCYIWASLRISLCTFLYVIKEAG